jgi:hypothetical protein
MPARQGTTMLVGLLGQAHRVFTVDGSDYARPGFGFQNRKKRAA